MHVKTFVVVDNCDALGTCMFKLGYLTTLMFLAFGCVMGLLSILMLSRFCLLNLGCLTILNRRALAYITWAFGKFKSFRRLHAELGTYFKL